MEYLLAALPPDGPLTIHPLAPLPERQPTTTASTPNGVRSKLRVTPK
jgi:hypothetical protein